MVFRHKSSGGGATIETMSPLYKWGQYTGEGGSAPEYAKSYPADKCTHKWPEPQGEKPRFYSDSTKPQYSESGSNYAGLRAGKTAAPNVTAPRGAKSPYDRGVPKGIPERNRFAQGFGWVGSGSGGTKGRRGKSG